MKPTSTHDKAAKFDPDGLLHPARAFRQPQDVVYDPDLTVNEKRAILASWASDACAVEAVPALRSVPSAGPVVTIDEVLEALRSLDKATNTLAAPTLLANRGVRRRSIEAFRVRRRRGQVDSTLSY